MSNDSIEQEINKVEEEMTKFEKENKDWMTSPIYVKLQERKISLLQTKIEHIINERQSNLNEIDLLDSETNFFKALFQSPEEEPLIRFGPNDKALKIPFGLNPKVAGLYVRKFYPNLFEKLAKSEASFQVVTANPGTGKTFFGLYLLRKFIGEQRSVLYEPNESGSSSDRKKRFYIYKIMPNDTDSDSDSVSIKKYKRENFFDNLKRANVENSNFIHIVDGHEPMRFGTVPIILVTSNRHMKLDVFKRGSFKQWFMPLWSLTELLDYRDRFYPDIGDDLVERLFDHWEGLIRYVIIKPVEYKCDEKLNDDEIVVQVDKVFDEAIRESNIHGTLVEYISERDSFGVSDKIVLLEIDDSTFQNQGRFMTRHARGEVIARLDENDKFKLLDSLGRFFKICDE